MAKGGYFMAKASSCMRLGARMSEAVSAASAFCPDGSGGSDFAGRALGAACAASCPSSGRRWSRRSPTWTRAISRPTSRPALGMAICCLWVVLLANLIAMLFQCTVRPHRGGHRPEPGVAVPDAFPAPGRHRHVDRQRDRRDGHRPCRDSRCGHRHQPAVRPVADVRPADHLRHHLGPADGPGDEASARSS